MCAPVLGIVPGIIGSVVGAIGAGAEADAQAAARERQAQIRELNAIEFRQKAALEADLKENEHERAISRQDVVAAANGIRVGGGSFDKIKREAEGNAYLDQMLILHRGERQAQNEENLANSDRAAASDIRKSGKIKAFSTILGGAAKGLRGVATQIA